jgi:hypothetical protein
MLYGHVAPSTAAYIVISVLPHAVDSGLFWCHQTCVMDTQFLKWFNERSTLTFWHVLSYCGRIKHPGFQTAY